MAIASIGLLHPGEMGAGIGAALVRSDYRVTWASAGRRRQSVERARDAGLVDVEAVEDVRDASDLVISVCPPHAALDVAKQVSGFGGIYLDANAIAPGTAREVADLVERGALATSTEALLARRPRPYKVPVCICPARGRPKSVRCSAAPRSKRLLSRRGKLRLLHSR